MESMANTGPLPHDPQAFTENHEVHAVAVGIPADHPLIIDHFDRGEFIEDLLQKHGAQTGVEYTRTSTATSRFGFGCSRAGVHAPKGAGVRKRRSFKTNCKWAADASIPSYKGAINPMWTLSIKNNTHNHAPLEARLLAPGVRLTPEIRLMIEEMSGNNAVKPRQIITEINQRYPGAVVTEKDIWNHRQKVKGLERRGGTPSTVFQSDGQNFQAEGQNVSG